MKQRLFFSLALIGAITAFILALKVFSDHYRIMGYCLLLIGFGSFARSAFIYKKIQ